jgi:L-fuculose-phosphate aldolase
MTGRLIDELSPRQRLALALRILGQAGYQDKMTGHLTVRDRDDHTVIVNPVDVLWADMRAADVLRVAPDGSVVEGNRRFNPTTGFHFAVHGRRPDIRVVLHNHPPYGNIWAAASRVPPLLDQSGANGGGSVVLVSEYEGTLEDTGRSERLAESFGNADIGVLAHHGVLVVGEDLDIVLGRAVAFEWRCQRAYQVAAMGIVDPVELPHEAAQQVAKYAHEFGEVFFEVFGRKVIDGDPSVLEED